MATVGAVDFHALAPGRQPRLLTGSRWPRSSWMFGSRCPAMTFVNMLEDRGLFDVLRIGLICDFEN
jgi:hypothetical protein